MDLFWILLEHGADMKSVRLATVASCCDKELMEFYFRHWNDVEDGYALYKVILAMPYPLTGIIKEFAPSVPNHKQQLGKALNHFVRDNRLRWIAMTVWMGADPRLPAPCPDDDKNEPETWVSPLELAADGGTLEALKLLKPSAETDDLNRLLEHLFIWDYKDLKIAEYLLSLGASVNNKPNGGCSILNRLFEERFSIHMHFHKDFWELRILEEWINRGAQFVPDSDNDLRHVRDYICHITQADIKRLLQILLRCMPAEQLLRIVKSPRVQKHIGFTPKQLREKLMEWQKPPPAKCPFMLPGQTTFKQARPRITVQRNITIRRSELYEQMWSKPALKLGQEWGISDVAIAKICKTNMIPKPAVGYWAKKAHGHRVSQKPLPDADTNPEICIRSHCVFPSIEDREIRQYLETLVHRLSDAQHSVEVDNPEELHPVTASLKPAKEDEHPDENRPLPRYKQTSDDALWLMFMLRAERVMNALLIFLESQGFRVESNPSRYHTYSAIARMFGIGVPFSIRLEGRKMLLSVDAYAHGLRGTWRDGKRHLVESYFADFACVVGYVAGLEKDKKLKKSNE